MFLGLRTVIHPAPDLGAAKAFWTGILGKEPYFDEPFYVGFDVGGYELGLNPAADPAAGAVAYWGVADPDDALRRLVAAGATEREAVTDVGGGIRVASVADPDGVVVGIIDNPHFALPDRAAEAPGPQSS
jgi:predicted enzyme related to lactoylglutathione lyase